VPEWRAPWSERVARWLVGGRDADAVAGDLSETGETGWNYWRQALSCFLVRISPHRRMIPDLRLDLRMAVRNIRRNPGYALTAVLCLGLAMGVNSTLFSFLDSVYFRRLPVPDARRVVRIVRDRSAACTWQEFLEMRAAARSLELTSVFRFGGSADIDRLNLGLIFESVSANYAQVLGLSTAMGRWFTSEEDLASAPAVVVISYRLWQSKLHGDPNVLGRQILVEELPFRIVGVAPEGFDGDMPPLVQDAWIPQASVNSQVGNNAGKVKIGLMGRLAPGASVAAAAAEIGVWDARLSSKKDDPLQVVPAAGFGGALGKRYLSAVLPMGSAVCSLVLLIACVNVANLLLGRAAVRRREIAVRLALGAGRARIFRETLTEGMVLAAGGVIAGLILGEWTGRALESALPSIPNQLYHGVALGADWRVALLLTAVGLVCALLFNLPAAFESGRCRINVNLHADVASQSGRQREFYSIAQVALSLALLVASGLVLRALQHVEAADPGFARDHRLLVDVYASPRAYKAGESQRLFTSLLDQARQIPGVLDATLALGPLGPAPGACASKSAAAPPVHVAFNTVEPNYFTMMRVPIVKGRGLTPSQSAEAVVSETMAHTWWPDGDALGKTFWTGCDAATRVPVEIVGVARDTRFALGVGQEPAYYVARQR
jgi:putative ABC transport system permease protein